MITLDDNPRLKSDGKYELSLSGKSTDQKPTGTFPHRGVNIPIGNASSFFEIDTKALKFYDETSNTWV